MKAVIFNSGLGKRMGALTEHCHKSMVRLQSGEAIFERQLRLLHECGVNEFVVTVGPFGEQLIAASQAPHLAGCQFTFVENPLYDKTNYIYSMYLAREHFTGDLLMLHGDLVFNKRLAQDIIASEIPSLGCVNRDKPLPEKDFKARVVDGRIHEVSISIFDDNCFAFQPFYKLSAEDAAAWIGQVEAFIEAGENQCYAENAMNQIFPQRQVKAFGYEEYFVDEVDNADDLRRVSEQIRRFDFDEQETHTSLAALNEIVEAYHIQKPLLVCGSVLESVQDALRFDYVPFHGYSPNPTYEEVCEGTAVFRRERCDGIISIGGGSAMDVAKCIKLYAAMDDSAPYIEQPYRFSPVKHIAVPTTAGTGSESTRFSVIYYQGLKQSVTHDSIFPDIAVFDSTLLRNLPDYHKKATLLDALCHGIESLWSVNADDDSIGCAGMAIGFVLGYYRAYLAGSEEAAEQMLQAANLAGRAINISQTTAGHAMSYKLTSDFRLAHGHAVALCLPEVWRYIAGHTDQCSNPRGEAHLREILGLLRDVFGADSDAAAIAAFEAIVDELGLERPHCADAQELDALADAVNPTRLRNNPVPLSRDVLRGLYEKIVIWEIG